jgi:hypothetical protein
MDRKGRGIIRSDRKISFGQGLSSSEQDCNHGQLDPGKKIPGEFIIASGDSAELLELVEEPLDEIELAVKHEIARSRGLAVGLWGITGMISRWVRVSTKGSES